jgi:tetratricopeptide (TPR) repeat protein
METLTNNMRHQIIDLLNEAEKARNDKNLKEALVILERAKKLTSTLKEEDGEGKASVANATFDSSVAEVTYNEKLGHILYDLGEYEGAMQCAERLRKLVPKEHRVEKEYGDCLRKQSRYNEALKAYDDALKKWQANKFSKKAQHKANILCSKGLVYLAQNQYEQALATFEEAVKTCPGNPLFECNRGKALFLKGDREAAQHCFARAQITSAELVKKLEEASEDEKAKVEKDVMSKTGLKKSNLAYISETLKELNNAIEVMLQDKLEEPDEFMENREANLINQNIEKMTGGKPTNIAADLQQVQDVKEKVRIIKKNNNLRYYYDGFLFTLTQSYSTSVVLTSGQVSKDTGNSSVSGASTLASYVPLIGSYISNVINTAWDVYKDAVMEKAANNVTSFATTQGDFEALGQDAICGVILEKQSELQDLAVEDYILPKWQARFKKLMDALDKLNRSIYGERNKKPLQQAGFQAASSIIEEHIASGQIYGDEDPIDLDDEVKVEKLKNAIRETLEKDLEAHRNKLRFDPKLHAPSQLSSHDGPVQKKKKKRFFFF